MLSKVSLTVHGHYLDIASDSVIGHETFSPHLGGKTFFS
jgi:hypothetical protein